MFFCIQQEKDSKIKFLLSYGKAKWSAWYDQWDRFSDEKFSEFIEYRLQYVLRNELKVL